MIATCSGTTRSDRWKISDITTILEEMRSIERFKPFDPIRRFRVAVLITVKDVLETRCIELYRS